MVITMKRQLKDPELESGARPVGPEVAVSCPASQHYWLYLESMKIMDGVMFCKFSRKDGTRENI